mgnify:CR=1 FL=1
MKVVQLIAWDHSHCEQAGQLSQRQEGVGGGGGRVVGGRVGAGVMTRSTYRMIGSGSSIILNIFLNFVQCKICEEKYVEYVGKI